MFLFAKVVRWYLVVVVLFGLVAMMLFGWVVRRALYMNPQDRPLTSQLALEAATVPDYIAVLLENGIELDENWMPVETNTQEKPFDSFSGLLREEPDFTDDGLLLVSAYSDRHQISTIYLYDLKEEKRLWEWVPNHQQISEMTPDFDHGPFNPRHTFQSNHSLLLEDGRILTTSGSGVLVMLDRNGDVIWTREGIHHHSIERMADGNFVVAKQLEKHESFIDDGYAIYTPDGELVEERSVLSILQRAGHGALVFGIQAWSPISPGGPADPVHLNDVEPIRVSDAYVQEGDLAMSSRHLSTVFLYRPSEDRILWLHTGPWLTQHDVDYLGDGIFSVFDNALVRAPVDRDLEYSRIFQKREPTSNIRTFDMETGEFATPFDRVFQERGLVTVTQGLHRHLRNGDVFIELQNQGQLMRLGPEGIRWRYVSNLDKPGHVGELHWSRYYYRDEVDLGWMDALKEEKPTPPNP